MDRRSFMLSCAAALGALSTRKFFDMAQNTWRNDNLLLAHTNPISGEVGGIDRSGAWFKVDPEYYATVYRNRIYFTTKPPPSFELVPIPGWIEVKATYLASAHPT